MYLHHPSSVNGLRSITLIGYIDEFASLVGLKTITVTPPVCVKLVINNANDCEDDIHTVLRMQ